MNQLTIYLIGRRSNFLPTLNSVPPCFLFKIVNASDSSAQFSYPALLTQKIEFFQTGSFT